MEHRQVFDVIIVGGSYAGLSAGLALGRALKKVLIIDSGKPCHQPTPHSHNFLTHDGHAPGKIVETAIKEVLQYPTVQYLHGLVTSVGGTNGDFEVVADDHQRFRARKLLFATGIRDKLPALEGFATCWGISVIHCPYCHGYEYRGKVTGILMNGEAAAEFAPFIHNWTDRLTLFTNGKAALTPEQQQKINSRNIRIVEKEIERLEHDQGYLKKAWFSDGSHEPLDALYARPAFEQHCRLPEKLGCAFTEQGYIQVDEMKRTSLAGVYAAGDNTTPFRSVASAVAAGTMAGAAINHHMISENS